MAMPRTRRYRGLLLLVATLVPTIVATPSDAQPQARTSLASFIVDGNGKIVGQLLTVNAIGNLGTPAVQVQVGTTMLRLNGKQLLVGASDDRFVGAPVFNFAVVGTANFGTSVNVVGYDDVNCTGTPFALNLLSSSVPPAAYGPGLVRRTAIGPGNLLYSEGDTVATVTIQSFFVPLDQLCVFNGTDELVKSAVLEADLDDHFTAPFSLR
jgi:hypothetical protein